MLSGSTLPMWLPVKVYQLSHGEFVCVTIERWESGKGLTRYSIKANTGLNHLIWKS